jgi:hypothetical protein
MPLENEMLWSSGFLCIGCLEKRLGRELTAEDFPDCPINHQHDLDTPRLASRKKQRKKAPIIPTTEPKYLVKKLTWWIVKAMEAGVVMDEPPYITEEDFIELGAPEWVWLAFQEELKEYFKFPMTLMILMMKRLPSVLTAEWRWLEVKYRTRSMVPRIPGWLP